MLKMPNLMDFSEIRVFAGVVFDVSRMKSKFEDFFLQFVVLNCEFAYRQSPNPLLLRRVASEVC